MTVTTTTTTNTYTGDGSTTAFSFTFEILETTDIKVIVVTTATGAESVRSIGTGSTNYAVTGTGNVNGGTVTFVTAPTASQTVFLMRNMSFTQPTNYRVNDPFPAETHENALDRMALQIQQIGRRLDRALLRPESDTTSGTLPHNIDLKGGVLKFNSSSGVPEADSTLTSVATTSVNGLMSSSDKAKLDGIEASATTDQTASDIRTLVESASDSNVFTDADHTKLNGIEASATADQDASDIRALGFFDTSNDGASSGLDADKLDGQEGSHYLDAGNLTGAVANARLDAQLQDVAGLAVTDSGFIVGDGSNFVLETGATVRTSLGLGTAATLDTGISNTNVPKFTSGVADDDFLRVNGTAIEGRSAAEVLSDIGGITASSTDTLTNKTIDASQLSGTVLDARLPDSISSNITGNAATATLASTATVSDSTANTNFPVVFHDESNALLDDTGALRYNPSTGELLVPKLTVAGTTTTVDTVTMNAANAIVFEGATADAFETTLTIQDPTGSDKTITLPNATGTILLADGDGSSLTNVNATTLDSVDSTSFLRSDAADVKTSGNLRFNDSVKATFGTTDDDLQIFHSGTNSFIQDLGTGNLYITSNGTQILLRNTADNEDLAKFINGGAVELYHDNSKKLETTSSGATVTGVLTADGLDLGDDEKIRLGASQDLEIYHDGSNSFINDVGTGSVVMRTNGSFFQFDTPSTVMAKFIKDGAVELRHNNNLKFSTSSTGATVTGVLTADGLDLGDDEKIRLGASQDLEIFHDGSNSFIKDTGTGDLVIEATHLRFRAANGETYFLGTANGAVELYYDNSKKIETTSTGATITGTAKATTAFQVDGASSGSGLFGASGSSGGAKINASAGSDATTFIDFDAPDISASGGDIFYRFGRGTTEATDELSALVFYAHDSGNNPVFQVTTNSDLTLTSYDAGSSENPTLDLYRNSASPATNDKLGHINFSGENDADEKIVYGEVEGQTTSAADGNEYGAVNISAMINGTFTQHYSAIFGENRFSRNIRLNTGINLLFEGATNNNNETTLTVTDPTADRTITLPDSTGTVQLTSSSDRRLKKNIEPASSASQKIDDINVYQFDWIEDNKHEDFGVVAQEMQEVFPDCVAVQDPETGYLGIDYSKLVPVLLKELKDLRARVADLENKDG